MCIRFYRHIDAEAKLHPAVPLQRMRQVEPLEQRLRPMIKKLHFSRVVSRLARIGYHIVAVTRHAEAQGYNSVSFKRHRTSS